MEPAGDKRSLIREMAGKASAEGRPLAWFEELYRLGRDEGVPIPWADGVPNPILAAFLPRLSLPPGRALVVGCGLGDDSEWLAGLGWAVTAFDLAPTAIEGCRARFPDSKVVYQAADLFAPPPEWERAFGLVVEVHTIQAMPAALWAGAMPRIASFVGAGGHLLVVCRGRLSDETFEGPPWPLSRADLALFKAGGLEEARFEELLDGETPPVRRFAACYQAP